MKFIAIDTSLRNTGVAIGTIKKIDKKFLIEITEIALISTKKADGKLKIRASSDLISRCKKTHDFVHDIIDLHQPHMIFVETPSGSQNSSGAKSYGSTCQLIAGITPSPFEVTPNEVKIATVGKKTATKVEMMEWARKMYPNLPWYLHPDGEMIGKNEHCADAIGVVHAGIKTPEFLKMIYMLNEIN